MPALFHCQVLQIDEMSSSMFPGHYLSSGTLFYRQWEKGQCRLEAQAQFIKQNLISSIREESGNQYFITKLLVGMKSNCVSSEMCLGGRGIGSSMSPGSDK